MTALKKDSPFNLISCSLLTQILHHPAKKIVFVIVSFLVFGPSMRGQEKKEVTGTFEIGCKAFNYKFVQNPNGLYTFRIEFGETETVIPVANKDSLKIFIKSIDAATTKLLDAVGENKEDPANKLKRDSIISLKEDITRFSSELINDKSTVEYISTRADSLRSLLAKAAILDLQSCWGDSAGKYTLFKMSEKIESAIEAARSIEEEKTYQMYVFEQEPFEKIVISQLEKRKIFFETECSKVGMVGKQATALFFEIKARLGFSDDEPPAATLKLKNTIVKCFLKSRSSVRGKKGLKTAQEEEKSLIVNDFSVEKVTVEFEDGALKNLVVGLLVLDDRGKPINRKDTIWFENVYPISISTKTDSKSFERMRIFANTPAQIGREYNLGTEEERKLTKRIKDSPTRGKNVVYSGKKSDRIYFYLSDLLDYVKELETDREDYSPANTVKTLDKATPSVVLKKEKRSKILTARAFTDFVGLQDEEPNGLVQVEASRKININTARYGGSMFYISFASYIEPILTFSKIEKNNNALSFGFADLDSNQLLGGKKILLANAIDLYQYQKISFETNLNIWKMHFPELKSNFQVNANLGIMKTNVVDTISVTGPNTAIKSDDPNLNIINTLRWGITGIWEIKSESRYGISFGWDVRRLNILNKTYTVALMNRYVINTGWVDAFLKTNDDNKLFFRFRFTYANKLTKNNFTQMQLGYLVDLFKSKK